MHDAPMIIEDDGLLPCPFCGGTADMEISEPHTHSLATYMPDSPGYVAVSCNSCTASVITDGTDIEAGRYAWNRRKDLTALVAEPTDSENVFISEIIRERIKDIPELLAKNPYVIQTGKYLIVAVVESLQQLKTDEGGCQGLCYIDMPSVSSSDSSKVE